VRTDITKHYKRKERIGKGNFATVYKWRKIDGAQNEISTEEYAVKSLEKRRNIEMAKKKKGDNPLLHEIDIMRMCDHPSVIKLYEVFEDQR